MDRSLIHKARVALGGPFLDGEISQKDLARFEQYVGQLPRVCKDDFDVLPPQICALERVCFEMIEMDLNPCRDIKLGVHVMPGKFIVLEGIDGSGKSTLAASLSKAMLRFGYRNTLAHEPGSKIEQDIRELFKSNNRPDADYMTVMFTADRLMYMRAVIHPALAQGLHVIEDRHKLSTLVYQTASGADSTLVRMLVNIPQPNPDLTIILDLPPEVARGRMQGRTLDSYERDMERQTFMRGLYLDHRNDFGPSVVLDATKSHSELVGDAIDAVTDLIDGVKQ